MKGTKLLLMDAVKGLERHLKINFDRVDYINTYIAMATHHISQVKLWGDTWLEELEKYKRTVEQLKATGNNTYTFIAQDVPVTFRVDYDDIELIGIATDNPDEQKKLRDDCKAFLAEMKERAAEDRAADSVLERGAA